MSTLKYAGDLYSKPALNAIGGARWSYRTYTFGTTELTYATSYIWAINILPAGHRLLGGFIEVDSLDSGATTTVTITVGILNSYFNRALPTVAVPAWYNGTDPDGFTHTDHSPTGAKDVATVSELVTSENVITTTTIGQAGGRCNFGVTTSPSTASTLQPSQAVGVNPTDDRIIAFTIPTAPATVRGVGTITVAILIDRDQSGYST